MPKRTTEHKEAIRDEIINICENLYKTMSFKDITIKEIGEHSAFTRTSIYNYFQTKEEIFLALLEREYNAWNESLKRMMERNETLTKEEFASRLAESLAERENLLKLLSMNHHDLEENSRIRNIAMFKLAYRETITSIGDALFKFFPNIELDAVNDFISVFFPFMYGVYPYTKSSKKQTEVVEQDGRLYVHYSNYDIIYKAIITLLRV